MAERVGEGWDAGKRGKIARNGRVIDYVI